MRRVGETLKIREDVAEPDAVVGEEHHLEVRLVDVLELGDVDDEDVGEVAALLDDLRVQLAEAPDDVRHRGGAVRHQRLGEEGDEHVLPDKRAEQREEGRDRVGDDGQVVADKEQLPLEHDVREQVDDLGGAKAVDERADGDDARVGEGVVAGALDGLGDAWRLDRDRAVGEGVGERQQALGKLCELGLLPDVLLEELDDLVVEAEAAVRGDEAEAVGERRVDLAQAVAVLAHPVGLRVFELDLHRRAGLWG